MESTIPESFNIGKMDYLDIAIR